MQKKPETIDFALGHDARARLKESLQIISQAVGSTLGPGGFPFGFDKVDTDLRRKATFTKDGLFTLRSLKFPGDPASQAVLQYCNQAASHTVLASGDGTTSTIILANAVAEAVQSEECKWPQALARELESDADRAVEMIKREAIQGPEISKLVALTSTNGDKELANIVIEAVNMSSAFGSILTIKNPAGRDRYKIDRQDGYSNCKGYDYNSTFATSASHEASAAKPIEWENPYVIAFNGNLLVDTAVDPIIDAWDKACRSGRNGDLVIIAYEVGDAVINKLLVLNRKLASRGLASFVVKPRLTAEVNSGLQIMRDISAFCGIPEEKIVDGGNFTEIDQSFFGTCKMVKVTPMNTMFLGRGPDHWVEKRILQNQSIVEEARSEFDKEITSVRNGELAEGLVKVEIGNGLLPDLKEREDRFDDASKAAQACMRSGALPGCGLSYIRAARLAQVHPKLEEAFRCIYNQIFNNQGLDPDKDFFPSLGHGISIVKDKFYYGNAVEMGVLDAAETVTSVIKNGVALGVKIATIGGFIYRELTDDEY